MPDVDRVAFSPELSSETGNAVSMLELVPEVDRAVSAKELSPEADIQPSLQSSLHHLS